MGAAAAFFSEQHLQILSPVLKGSSSSHPRLHSLWPTLLALLLPGFKAVKVSNSSVCSGLSMQQQSVQVLISAWDLRGNGGLLRGSTWFQQL